MADDLALALELVDVADAMTLGRYRADDLVVETKPDLTPVTEADRGVEQAIRERLAALRSEDAVLGEEFGGGDRRATRRRWIIDPIDGTKNYVRGIPAWATLLALEADGELVLGVVVGAGAAPALVGLERRRRVRRRRTRRATRPMRVSGVRDARDAQLCLLGVRGLGAVGGAGAAAGARRAVLAHARVRRLLELHARRRGRGRVACEPEVSLWDLAAPRVIVEEAGGRFTDLGRRPGRSRR